MQLARLRAPILVITLVCTVALLSWLDHKVALAKCWEEGPSWARFKMCDWETPVEDTEREVGNAAEWVIAKGTGIAGCPAWVTGAAVYEYSLSVQPLLFDDVTIMPIPRKVRQAIGPTTYGSLNLNLIQIVTGVGNLSVLGSGTAQTFGNYIYFPKLYDGENKERTFDPENNWGDLYWLLHELEHSQQYAALGGFAPFMTKYLCTESCMEVKHRQYRGDNLPYLDMHKCNQIEVDANSKADDIIWDVWCELAWIKGKQPLPANCPSQRTRQTVMEHFYDSDPLGSDNQFWDRARYNVHVDASYKGPEYGTEANPVNSLAEAQELAQVGQLIIAKAGDYREYLQLNKPLTLITSGGTVRISEPDQGIGLVAPPPVFPGIGQLAFYAMQGSFSPNSQTLPILHSGSSSRNWEAESSEVWLRISEASGFTPASIRVSVDLGGLSVGTHEGQLKIREAGNPESERIVQVVFVVQSPQGDPNGGLLLSPESIALSTEAGSTASLSGYFGVLNEAPGTAAWSASPTVPWLNIEPRNGTTPATVSIEVDGSALNQGTNVGWIIVKGTHGESAIEITVQAGADSAFEIYLPSVRR